MDEERTHTNEELEGALASTKHPHEPEIPPALDDEGRCLVCGLLVELERYEQPRLAGRIELVRRKSGTGTPFEFTVDGKPFPFYVATDPDIRVSPGMSPRVTITVLCEELVVVDTFDTEVGDLPSMPAPEGDRVIRNTEVHDRLAGKDTAEAPS